MVKLVNNPEQSSFLMITLDDFKLKFIQMTGLSLGTLMKHQIEMRCVSLRNYRMKFGI
jgi:hypothetical protein